MSNETNISWSDIHTLVANAYTKTNFTFNGWNSKADGSGIAYANEGTYAGLTIDSSHTVTLYAQWKRKMYPTTPLSCKSGAGESYSVSKTYSCRTAITITDNSNSSWYRTSDRCYVRSSYLQTSSTPCS